MTDDHETTTARTLAGPSPVPSHASPPDGPELWASVEELTDWMDSHRAHGGREGLLLRILKLSEEAGEVAQAVIGVTGQNPRKGVTHTWEDVQGELCDVVITALVALRTLTPDARDVFTRHLAGVLTRSLAVGDEPARGTRTDGRHGGGPHADGTPAARTPRPRASG